MALARGVSRRWLPVLAALVWLASAVAADAQVFLAERPHPTFTIGPLFVRASVGPNLEALTVDVLWSLVVPPTQSGADVEQDIYLLWPDDVGPLTVEGPPDPALARYVEARGYSATREGRLPLLAKRLYQVSEETPPEPIPGGAPFVTFVRQGGPLGLTSPVSHIRIPWTPLLVNRIWLVSVRMQLPQFARPRRAGWTERVFWGHQHVLALTFNDVRPRAMLPLYLENRDRLVRLADEPSQLIANFSHAERLKIAEISPRSASRRTSETLEGTEEVSQFIETSDASTPQVLTVQFAYFTWWQSWAPVLIPALFFVLGNAAGPLVNALVRWLGATLAAKVQFGPSGTPSARQTGTILRREVLERIVPGVTTRDEVLRLGGPGAEEQEEPLAPDRRVLVYRGTRVVPQRRRRFGWLSTVTQWDTENHEVAITLEQNVVRDVRAHVRKAGLPTPGI
jgi:hypothetical protein